MQVRKSLVWKIIVPILVVMVLVVVSILYYLPQAITDNAISEAQIKAENTVDRFKRLRGYYTDNIVSDVLEHSEIKVGIAHQGSNGTIPLPATMIHDLSEQFSQRGTQLKLYSPYPFPNRSDRELDQFAQQAWEYLNKNPSARFSQVLANPDGLKVVRVAIADTLVSQACVQCHNSHPSSPKIDWEIGDVRGILEVDSVIDPAIQKGEELGFKLTVFICAAIFILVILIYVIHRHIFQTPLHNLALLLEGGNRKDKEDLVSSFSLYPASFPEDHPHNEISFLYHKFLQQHQRLEENERSMRAYQEKLEAEVELNAQLLEERNEQLSETQDQLVSTQKELLQTEKLSALNKLVSSIGHEISTPLGVSTTASSYFLEETEEIIELFRANQVTRSKLEKYLEDNQEAGGLLKSNLTRAHELMLAFKEVAVDQLSEQLRLINLHDYIEDVLLSLKPTYKNAPIEVLNNVDKSIKLELEPGAVAQIVTNLVTNSLMHGFDDSELPGIITLSSETNFNEYVLIYEDNGKGMPEDVKTHVFEQFYTTRKGRGGSGIGMYIINELVQERLQGTIELISQEGEGICVRITLPQTVLKPELSATAIDIED